jgi:hypothetical protein
MTGKVTAAELAPLERLSKLRSITLSASRQAEEGGEHCLAGFPEVLLKLKGVTSLAVSSMGACLAQLAPDSQVPAPAEAIADTTP